MASLAKRSPLGPLLKWVATLLFCDGALGKVVYWSEVKNTTADQCTGKHCVVPAGDVWFLDASMEVETLTVHGMLKWDTSYDALEIRTAYLLVGEGGYFRVGSPAWPMINQAKIYITRRDPETHSHPHLGYRFVGSVGQDSRIDIHGRKFAKTWTLLARTAVKGTREIFIKDDPVLMGWKVGDRIGIATTLRGNSSLHTISKMGPASEWQLELKSVGGIEGHSAGLYSGTAVAGDSRHWGRFCTDPCILSHRYLEIFLKVPSNISRLRLNWDSLLYAPKYTIEVRDATGEGEWTRATAVANAVGGWLEVPVDGLTAPVSAFRIVVDAAALGVRATGQARRGVLLTEVEAYGTEVSGWTPNVLHLEEPLEYKHWGGYTDISGRQFEMAAEVVNLERSVTITGDHDDYEHTQEGIHTGMFGKGTMDIRFVRIEHCGQRDRWDRFCMQFNQGGHCTECTFQGNAIVDSAQVGIAIAHTHRTLVVNNVIWDAKGAGVYIKDGNEMYNTISSNVMICSVPGKCSVKWLGNKGAAGIYMIGMTNSLIENRVAGYENGIWAAGSRYPHGQANAEWKVCPQFTPFGTVRGNVNHDCQRYGLRLDRQHPRNVERDQNGYITDSGSCGEFTDDGLDNGVVPASVIQDQFDWHNMFVGQFAVGDVSFVRLTSVNNHYSLIWKESKAFADPRAAHIEESIFANNPLDQYGRVQAQGPAGNFGFLIRNSSFLGGPTDTAALAAGLHCGRANAGGPCAVQYALHAVDFSGLQKTCKRIQFGVNAMPQGKALPMFLSDDDSLNGYRSIVSGLLEGFEGVPGCEALDLVWDSGIGCADHVRRLTVKSMDLGALTLSGPGYEVEANMSEPIYGANGGMMYFESNDNTTRKGYAVPVVVGRSYHLDGPWKGDVILGFSDLTTQHFFGIQDTLNITFGGQECRLQPEPVRKHAMFMEETCSLKGGGQAYVKADPPANATTAGPGYDTDYTAQSE